MKYLVKNAKKVRSGNENTDAPPELEERFGNVDPQTSVVNLCLIQSAHEFLAKRAAILIQIPADKQHTQDALTTMAADMAQAAAHQSEDFRTRQQRLFHRLRPFYEAGTIERGGIALVLHVAPQLAPGEDCPEAIKVAQKLPRKNPFRHEMRTAPTSNAVGAAVGAQDTGTDDGAAAAIASQAGPNDERAADAAVTTTTAAGDPHDSDDNGGGSDTGSDSSLEANFASLDEDEWAYD